MNNRMRELLNLIQRSNFSTEEIIEIFTALRPYMRAKEDFLDSTTPEAEELARWRLDAARKAWRKEARKLNLPTVEADYYF